MNRRSVVWGIWWCAEATGAALWLYAVTRHRLFDHHLGVGLDKIQAAVDHALGTYGIRYVLGSLLAGAGAFALLWLWGLMVTLLRGKRPWCTASTYTTGVLRPMVLLIPAAALILISPALKVYAVCLTGLAIMLIVASALHKELAREEDPKQEGVARMVGRVLALAGLLALPLLAMAAMYVYGKHVGPAENVSAGDSVCVLSFDTERDWWAKEDQPISARARKNKGYDTFKYIDSGMLVKLGRELAARKIEATFYCTPQMAQARPKAVRVLQDLGHEIGVHIHVERMRPSERSRAIVEAKRNVEAISGQEAVSFRTGIWLCNPRIEEICSRAGFRTLSNHDHSYMLPNGMVQIRAHKQTDVIRCTSLAIAIARKSKRDMALFSHPMVLYDHAKKAARAERLRAFLKTLDEFRSRCPDMRFITAKTFGEKARYHAPGWLLSGSVMGVSCVLMILSLCLAVYSRNVGSGFRE